MDISLAITIHQLVQQTVCIIKDSNNYCQMYMYTVNGIIERGQLQINGSTRTDCYNCSRIKAINPITSLYKPRFLFYFLSTCVQKKILSPQKLLLFDPFQFYYKEIINLPISRE